jgi:hypothetical protein
MRIFHRDQQLGCLGNVLQVGNQVAADRASPEVLFLFGITAGFYNERQHPLEFYAVHVSSLPDIEPLPPLNAWRPFRLC